MSDYIEKYKEAMEKLPIRDSFEEETMQLLDDTKKVRKRGKVLQFEQWGKAAAAFVMICLLGAGTVVTAAEFNLPQLVQRLFGDDVSAMKIATEQYQKVALSVTDGERTVQALGVVGDEDTTWLLLEFTLADTVAEGESVTGLHIGTYKEGETVTFSDWYPVEEVLAEDGGRHYLLEYEIRWGWSNDSKKNDRELHVVVDGMSVTGGEFEEQHYFRDLELTLILEDTFSEKAREFSVEKSVSYGESEVTVEAVRLSAYRTGLLIHYPAESIWEAYEIFDMLTKEWIVRQGEQVENSERLTLYHNGQKVDYSDKFVNYIPGSLDGTDGPGEYGCSLFLEAIDYKEGDTLEIHLEEEIIPIL